MKAPPGPVGFIPAASGSNDYPRHFAEYMEEAFGREVEIIPIYRSRDGRRGRNSERIRDVAAVYLGGGVPDHLLEAIEDTPAAEALARKILDGGVVVAIAAAAQCAGRFARSIFRGDLIPGFGWVAGDYLGIDVGPTLLAIENHRSGLVWELLRKHPAIRRGLERAGFTGGWLGT